MNAANGLASTATAPFSNGSTELPKDMPVQEIESTQERAGSEDKTSEHHTETVKDT